MLPKMKESRMLAEQFTDLDDPAPKDFDPEEPEDRFSQGSGDEGVSDAGSEAFNGRAHYEVVGKSKLRKLEGVEFGLQYKGSRVSREALLADDGSDPGPSASGESEEDDGESEDVDKSDVRLNGSAAVRSEDEDIDCDEAFGDSDFERFRDFPFRGNPSLKSTPKRTVGSSVTLNGKAGKSNDTVRSESESGSSDEFSGLDSQENEEDRESNGDEDMVSNGDEETHATGDDEDGEDEDMDSTEDEDMSGAGDEAYSREELRKMMAQEQKIVIASISKAAKADAEKGQAVKTQRSTFDALLNTRIRLQKALVSTNSLPALKSLESAVGAGDNNAVKAAEQAAIRLWCALDSLREDISKVHSGHTTTSQVGSKRKREAHITSLGDMWNTMQAHESRLLQTRRTTLEKWSAKARGILTLPLSQKLNNTVIQQTITDVLEEQLTQSERLIKRTRVPRSCAPVQAQNKVIEDEEIFDDADFYQMLLKELVDQRMLDCSSRKGEAVQWAAVREAKTKKNVDTKASKGRKLRYTVHEKIQNFMAPQDAGIWGQKQIDELFGSLLGQQTRLQEGAESEDGDHDAQGEESLKLFRSAA